MLLTDRLAGPLVRSGRLSFCLRLEIDFATHAAVCLSVQVVYYCVTVILLVGCRKWITN